MPGSSLWLLPPADHPLSAILADLIDKSSSNFGSLHRFLPHVTLTSEISPSQYGSEPQRWLESLCFPRVENVSVNFEKVASEDVFFRKLYIKCVKSEGVKELAKVCRQKVVGYDETEKAEQWATQDYYPHLSLMYHNCPKLGKDEIERAEKSMHDIGIVIHGQQSAWKGGRVVLVPTDKPIDQWNPIAEREL